MFRSRKYHSNIFCFLSEALLFAFITAPLYFLYHVWSAENSAPVCAEITNKTVGFNFGKKKKTVALPFNDPTACPTGLFLMIWWGGWWWHWSLRVYPPPPLLGTCVRYAISTPTLTPPPRSQSCFPTCTGAFARSAHWLISIHTITQQPLYTSVHLSMSWRLAEIDKHWHGSCGGPGHLT